MEVILKVLDLRLTCKQHCRIWQANSLILPWISNKPYLALDCSKYMSHFFFRKIFNFQVPFFKYYPLSKYNVLIWSVLLILGILPFVSNNMVGWLSWYNLLCSTECPCASMKYFDHNTNPRLSSSPHNSHLVKLLIFNSWFLKNLALTPYPVISWYRYFL